jgi:hypothetical protein
MSVKRAVREASQDANPKQVRRAYLAEAYDGIGQYVNVALSTGSSSSAIARVPNSGVYKVPLEAGAPVSVTVHRGSVEVVGLGS